METPVNDKPICQICKKTKAAFHFPRPNLYICKPCFDKEFLAGNISMWDIAPTEIWEEMIKFEGERWKGEVRR